MRHRERPYHLTGGVRAFSRPKKQDDEFKEAMLKGTATRTSPPTLEELRTLGLSILLRRLREAPAEEAAAEELEAPFASSEELVMLSGSG